MNTENNLPYIDKAAILLAEFRRLYSKRISTKHSTKKTQKKNLQKHEKIEILKKTCNCCHICGQELDPSNFQADHISPQSTGGVATKLKIIWQPAIYVTTIDGIIYQKKLGG